MNIPAHNIRGFTLIEVLVSVAIFSVVMTIALGALLAMSESDRKAQTLKSVINNLNFSLDSLSRAARIGTNYHCDASVWTFSTPRDCAVTPASSFAFQAGDSSTTYFCLGNSSTCSTTGTAILRSIAGGALVPITSGEVRISSLNFYVTGSSSADALQPKVTILVSGTVVVSGTQTSQFNLQTSVTQRVYDQ